MKVRLVFGAIGLLFLALGIAGIYLMLIEPLMLSHDVKNWTKTPCTIVSAKLDIHQSYRTRSVSIGINYEYEFSGEKYSSNRYSFATGIGGYSDRMEKIIRHYKTADNPFCYVNPHKPYEAVLQPKIDFDILWGLSPLFLVYIFYVFIKVAFEKEEREGNTEEVEFQFKWENED